MHFLQKIFYTLVFAMSCCFNVAWGQNGPVMNQAYTIDVPFTGSNSHNISKDYFLSGATSAVVQLTNVGWATMRIGQWGQDNVLKDGVSNNTFSYELTGDNLTAALAGNIYLQCEPASNSKLTILNKDANYQEQSSGGSGDSGNTGAGSSTKTLAQKIADKDQLTDVPTLYFTISSIPEGADINTYLKKDDTGAEYLSAVIQVVDKTEGGLTEFTDNVQIKVRGNSTAKENKKPYRLKFAKDEKDAAGNVTVKHKHDLLGKGYSKRNWALLANFIDPATVRNALTYKVGELVDMPFKPGYKFADVVINGEYRGTYQITDHVEVGSNRIDIDEDTGWFLESARGDMVEQPSASAQSLFMSIKNPEPATDAETATLKSQIENWFKPVDALFCIYNGTFDLAAFTNPTTGWRKYWDEESLVNFYLGINITGDYDGFMTVKMYRDVNGKMKFGPIWDKDLAYGNWSADDGKKLAEDQQSGSYFSSYVKKLWLDPVFVKKVHDKMATLVANGLSTTLENYVDALVSETAQTDALDHTKWSTSYSSWTLSFTSREGAVAQLKEYLAPHITWLKNTIDKQYQALGGDAIVDNTTGGDSGEEGGEGSFDPNTTITIKDASNKSFKVPASAFSSKATSIKVTFTPADTSQSYWGFYGFNGSEWNAKTFNGTTAPSVTITITDAADITAVSTNGLSCQIQTNGNIGDLAVKVENEIPESGDTPTPATRKQLTNLPTIYLDATVGDDWSTASLEVFDADNKLTQGTTWTSSAVSVQYQGGHSEGTKDSYRLKFDSKTKLLSSGKFKQWVLASNDDDPSLINNAMAKELGDLVGMPFTPGYQFVDLYLNDTYMGTYQVTDRIKTESGRALVTGGDKDNDWHVRINDNDEITEGGYTTDEYVVATSSMPNLVIKNPDPDDLTATELATLKNNMNTWFTTFFTKDANGHYSSVAANVDKQQIINWYICQEVLAIYKGLSSIEAYRSITDAATDQTLHFGPLWDNETAFGNRGDEDGELSMSDLETANSYNGLIFKYNKYGLMKSFIEDLWKQSWFACGVRDKWNALEEAGILATLKDKATTISAMLSESQPKNLEKWTNSLKTKYNSYSTYSAAVAAISTYLDQRVPYLTTKFNALAAGMCEHNYRYADNNDGTHKHYCTECNYAEVESEIHNLSAVTNGKTNCSLCNAEITVNGSKTGEKVYILDAGTTKVQYITKTSGFTPIANTLYVINEKPEEGTSFDNVYWVDGGDNYADNIVVTDGTAWLGEVKVYSKEATYSRSMGASSIWGTVCVPFKTKTNEDVTLYELSSSATDGHGNGTMTFVDATSTGGNTPLVYKKNNSSATSVTFSCEKQATGYVTVKEADGISKNVSKKVPSGWEFLGNVKATKSYETSENANPAYYYIASNKFWQATGSLKIAPFRAYFKYTYDASPGAKAASFSISDDTATDITTVCNQQKVLAIFSASGGVSIVSPRDMNVRIYSTSGALVKSLDMSANESRFVALNSGVYVVNGLKFIVK